MSSDRALIEVRNLTVDYVGDNSIARAVNGIDFDIREGEAFGLAGESGCGKSTVAFALARLTRLPGLVSGGEVRLDGEDVLKFDKARLQGLSLARGELRLPVGDERAQSGDPDLRADHRRHRDARTAARQGRRRASAPSSCSSWSAFRRRASTNIAHQFSGGMRQRICIAIALALKPRLIIMDEPTTALDVVVQRDIIEQIVELKNRLGFSVLFITHDLGLMIEFCDRIGVMYSGELGRGRAGRRPSSPIRSTPTRGRWATASRRSPGRASGSRASPARRRACTDLPVGLPVRAALPARHGCLPPGSRRSCGNYPEHQ